MLIVRCPRETTTTRERGNSPPVDILRQGRTRPREILPKNRIWEGGTRLFEGCLRRCLTVTNFYEGTYNKRKEGLVQRKGLEARKKRGQGSSKTCGRSDLIISGNKVRVVKGF